MMAVLLNQTFDHTTRELISKLEDGIVLSNEIAKTLVIPPAAGAIVDIVGEKFIVQSIERNGRSWEAVYIKYDYWRQMLGFGKI